MAGMGIAGTLGGIGLGHLLTRSWQREQWRLDKRREEYRELLSSLSASYSSLNHIYDATSARRAITEEISLQAEQAKIDSLRVIYDRILIADDVRHIELLKHWSYAVDEYLKHKDGFAFAQEFFSITAEIVTLAKGPQKLSWLAKWKNYRLRKSLDKAFKPIL